MSESAQLAGAPRRSTISHGAFVALLAATALGCGALIAMASSPKPGPALMAEARAEAPAETPILDMLEEGVERQNPGADLVGRRARSLAARLADQFGTDPEQVAVVFTLHAATLQGEGIIVEVLRQMEAVNALDLKAQSRSDLDLLLCVYDQARRRSEGHILATMAMGDFASKSKLAPR